MQEAYRWLQETFGCCHCCERVCNQILRKGAFIAARAVFSCFFFEITTCKLKNNVLCLITLDLQLKNPDDIILVHFYLFLKILYRLCKKWRGANNGEQDCTKSWLFGNICEEFAGQKLLNLLMLKYSLFYSYGNTYLVLPWCKWKWQQMLWRDNSKTSTKREWFCRWWPQIIALSLSFLTDLSLVLWF